MECRQCQYPLWNIRERVCPECGSPFAPSDFEFLANAVVYLCPHCSQQYFGTDERGHLVPRGFRCVSCSRPIEMDEMVLASREDIQVRAVRAEPNPMLLPGRWGGPTWRTIKYSISRPVQLVRVTPVDASLGVAQRFLATTTTIAALGASGLFCCVPFIAWGSARSGTVPWEPLITVASVLGAVFLLANAWMLSSHAILRVIASPSQGLRRTIQAFAYTSGVMVWGAIPLLGHMVWPIVVIVWACLAAEAIALSHDVRRWRAYVAAGAPLALAVALAIGGVVYLSYAVQRQVATIPQKLAKMQAKQAGIFLDSQGSRTGTIPHPVDLLVSPTDGTFLLGYVHPDGAGSGHALTPLPILEGRSVQGVSMMPKGEREALARRVKDQLAGRPVRLGNVVFVASDIPYPQDLDSPLWLVVILPDPAEGSAGDIESVRKLGQSTTHAPGEFHAALEEQNALRAEQGLAPLPDLTALPDLLQEAPPPTP